MSDVAGRRGSAAATGDAPSARPRPNAATSQSQPAFSRTNGAVESAGVGGRGIETATAIIATAPAAEIRLAREDGRRLLARVDALGRCHMEVFHREIGLGVPANHRGRHARFPLAEDLFLGRTRHEGPRARPRRLPRYLADNALRPISLAELRGAWARAMAVPTRTNY